MSGIVLSASVRQNLLSLQSTADLLATTQNRLATGNKVNSALDNPTNFFTAQGLNNRASDISNLLDSIGNGVQVLQAANTGITSLQKLVDTAKSIANQVLQAPTGYSTKANVTSRRRPAPARWRAGTAADLTNAGTNSLNGKTFIFTTCDGAATTHHGQQHGCCRQRQLDRRASTRALAARPRLDGVVDQRRLDHASPPPTTMPARLIDHDAGTAPPLPAGRHSATLRHRRLAGQAASPMRPRRPFAPTWSASTTTSSRRSRRPRRIRPSTASTC